MQVDKSIIAGGIILAGLVGYLAFFGNNESQLPEGIIAGNGRIEAVQIDISTKIPGRIKKIMVREGDLVGEGQQLALIDAAQLQAQLFRAKADIARAQSLVAQAKASIAQAKAQLNLAKKELDRASALVKRGHTSEQTYDIRLNQHEVAKANLGAAEAMLVSRERGVDAARAGAQEIETQIKDCILISPTVGRVLYRLAEPGEVLGPGGRVLTLVNLADVYMEIFLPAIAAHRLSIGS